MPRPRGWPMSPAERKRKLNTWDKFCAGAIGVEPQFQREVREVKPRRAACALTSPELLEKDVLRAVGDLLAVHPRVLFAVRQNSGAMQYESAGNPGRPIPVWFYRIVRKPKDMTITDFWGFLQDGRPFAIECKRPGWKGPSTERELKQFAFIEMVRVLGGLGGFVSDAEQVARWLKA